MSTFVNVIITEKRRIAILVSRQDGYTPLIESGEYRVLHKDGTELTPETPIDGMEDVIVGTTHKKRIWALIDFVDTIFDPNSIVYVCFWLTTSSGMRINGRVRVNIGTCDGGW